MIVVYQEFKLENVKCLHFANVLKKLTCDDTNPLYNKKSFFLLKFFKIIFNTLKIHLKILNYIFLQIEAQIRINF